MLGRLSPIGFWSYARTDETASNGKLSSLRARLQAELQQQYGRDQVRIFQDVAAIAPGDGWERELRDAIENSTFLVPIITPGFLESQWCCQEVMLFLEREKVLNAAHQQLDGRSRIFPIHYIDTATAEPFDADVLPALMTRQWLDFRDLRFSPDGDPALQKTLAKLATGMNELLQIRVDLPDAPPAPPPPPPKTRAPRPTGLVPPPMYDAPAAPETAAAVKWFMKPWVWAVAGAVVLILFALYLAGDDTPPQPIDKAEAPIATAPAADSSGAANERGGYSIDGADLFARSAVTASKTADANATSFKFSVRNHTSDAINVLWVDTGGKLESYGTLKAGDRTEFDTFPGHVWVLRRQSDGTEITGFVPPEGGMVTIARAEPAEAPIADASAIPPGNYANTCEDIRVIGNDLHAVCRDVDQNSVATVLPNYKACTLQIRNKNGALACR